MSEIRMNLSFFASRIKEKLANLLVEFETSSDI